MTTTSASTALSEDERFFYSLDHASKTVQAFMQDDSRWSDLADQLSKQNTPAVDVGYSFLFFRCSSVPIQATSDKPMGTS